ncbi:MAG: hypothetical protein ACOX8I_02230 [Bacillota bacterium]|jgi:hypothetical protein
MEDSKVAVLLEDIRSQIRTIGEGLQILDEKFIRGYQEMNANFSKLEARFDRFEHQNQQEHRLMMQMIKELGEEQQKLKKAK